MPTRKHVERPRRAGTRSGTPHPGVELRRLRLAAQLTSAKAAALNGLSMDQWSRYETGRSAPPAWRLPLLVAALKSRAKRRARGAA